MYIHNLAMVRATNHIPVDGVILPTSEECVLRDGSHISSYSSQIIKMLQKKEEMRDKSNKDEKPYYYSYEQVKKDMTEAGEITGDEEDLYTIVSDRMIELNNEILKDYLPLTGDYNSMTLFSLNSIVPDDGEIGTFAGNVFSNKCCAVIDGVEEHIDEIISLNPTDTAIKGPVTLSPNAVILINEEAIKTLTDEQIKFLQSHYTVATFKGSLKDAVTTYLTKSERYTSENLLTIKNKMRDLKTHLIDERNPLREDVDYEFARTVNEVATTNNISLAFHFDILTNRTDLSGRLECAKGEMLKMQIVYNFYKEHFYNYIAPKINIDEDTKYYLINSDATFYFETLGEYINKYGFNNYRQLVMNYNKALENLRDNKKLPTAQEIVDCKDKGTPLDISQLIEDEVKKINSQKSQNDSTSVGENEGTDR